MYNYKIKAPWFEKKRISEGKNWATWWIDIKSWQSVVLELPKIDKRYYRYHKEKVYARLVDFRQAFDSVWLEGLFLKLLKITTGNFYNLIKQLYCNSTCSVKIGENKTLSFSVILKWCTSRLGLSPLLFNLYINNLPYLFEKTLSDPCFT